MKQQTLISEHNQKKLGKFLQTIVISVMLVGIFTSCAPEEISAYLQEETPTIEVTETLEPTIEPTPTEIPPDIDLTWDWIDFEGYFRMTPKAEQMEESFKPEEGKSKYVVFGGNAGKMMNFNRTYPTTEEDLNYFDTVNKLNELMKLDLDQKGEEILRLMYLYQLEEGEDTKDQDVFVYIYAKDGCIYEKSGPLSIIWQDGTVEVVKEEDIPWDKIPHAVWDDIAAGYTKIDLSGDEVVYSCNINDIRASSEK